MLLLRKGEAIFKQIVHATNRLEACLVDQAWQEAAVVERERYALLQQLSKIESVTKSAHYAGFLQQSLAFIKAKQPELEAELQRSRKQLSELGQQRVAANRYRDVSVA